MQKSSLVVTLIYGRRSSIDPPRIGIGSASMPGRRRNRTGGASSTRQPLRSILIDLPVIIAEIEIYPFADLHDAHIDLALRPDVLRSRVDDVEGGRHGLGIRCAVGLFDNSAASASLGNPSI